MCANRACHLRSGMQASLVLRNVEIGLVEGQRLNQVGVALEDFAHLARDRPVTREVRGQEDCVRAQAFGSNSGHGGTHAELSRFIRSSAHYRAIPAPCDDDGLASELRIIPLLYGRIKRVHVDMNDLANGYLATILFRSSTRARAPLGHTKARRHPDASGPV